MLDFIAIGRCPTRNYDGSGQVFPAGRATAFGLAAALAIAVGGAVAENFPSLPDIAKLEIDKREYAPSEAIRVTLTNSSDTAISCPVAPDACALMRFEREQDGAWQRWSACGRLRKVDRPLLIEPGGVLEGSLRRGYGQVSGCPPVDSPDAYQDYRSSPFEAGDAEWQSWRRRSALSRAT